MIEQFDIVDISDAPTGQLTTKKLAHGDGTLHRLVAVYVFDTNGNLLVQDHKKSGLFDHSVGGHVAAGESYVEAVKREAEEELGLFNQELEPVFEGLYSDERFNPTVQDSVQVHMFSIFDCHPTQGWVFNSNDEVDSVFPMTIEAVVNKMNADPSLFTPGFINTMSKYLEVKHLPFKLDIENCIKEWGRK
jgi:isopentenyldiphosphate isomerase